MKHHGHSAQNPSFSYRTEIAPTKYTQKQLQKKKKSPKRRFDINT